MGKRPVKWHQECLRNMQKSLTCEVREFDRLKARITVLAERIERLEAQIARAIKEGRDGFDDEKFLPLKGGE